MLLDDDLVLLDGAGLDKAVTGEPVALNALFKPGVHHDRIPMAVMLTEDAAGGTSVTLKLQQADEKAGTYADVPGSSLTVLLADMTRGKNIGWRTLPAGVTKSWIKMTATPTGTFTAGKLFAAVTREEMQPYSDGLYINAGKTPA